MNIANVYSLLRPRFKILQTNTRCEYGKKQVVVHLGIPGKKLTIFITKKGYVLFTLADETKGIMFPSQPTTPRYSVANLKDFLASPDAKYVLSI